ncbi:MAG: alginate lyase family protein [Alphaproteobacteria bacterium]|nr:MAG: alginate lyase family protein [Alphaproteobacteria bacterium]
MKPACPTQFESQGIPAIRVRFEPEFDNAEAVEEWYCGHFTTGGETHSIDWVTNPSDDLEWHIVLHKFHHAPILVQRWLQTGEARHLDLLETHIAQWIGEIPPGFIAADVTGRRIRNWVYALSLLGTARPKLSAAMATSLRHQVEWLQANLHAKRNHRTLELFAIYIAGVWLGEAGLTDFAMDELLANARSDFLSDGVHIELSSHYHCIALRNFCEAIELADDNGLPVPSELRAIVARASHFARVLHKPDGHIPALSDGDTGDYRAMLGLGKASKLVELFPAGGYAVMRDRRAVLGHRDGGYLAFDCGDIGAGNHGHLDCLSFEFAACGRSLIVDPGRYTYHEGGETNWRAEFRRTRAHNLVQVNRCEQTLYRQGPKRMKINGPAPVAELLAYHDLGHCRIVQASAASHEYAVVHQRSIISHDHGWWLVHDRLEGLEENLYEALFQLAPEAQDHVRAPQSTSGFGRIEMPDLAMIVASSHNPQIELEQGWVAPTYGMKLAAPRIVAAQTAQSSWFGTLLLPGGLASRSLKFNCEANGFTVNGEYFSIPYVAELPGARGR